jgi:hypothetical protein
LIEEGRGDFLLNLDPFIRESRKASDAYSSQAADKLGIFISSVCNAVCKACTVHALYVETYHICIEEAQALKPDRTETSSCLLAKAMGDAHLLYQVPLWSSLVCSFHTYSEEGDILPDCQLQSVPLRLEYALRSVLTFDVVRRKLMIQIVQMMNVLFNFFKAYMY